MAYRMTAENADDLMIKLMVYFTQLENGQLNLLRDYVKIHTLHQLAVDIQVAKERNEGELGALAMDDAEHKMLCLYIAQNPLEKFADNIEIAVQTQTLLGMI